MQVDRPIAIAIILFIIILLIFFLVMPEYRTFKSLRTELGEKTAEFNAKYDYYAEIDKTHNDLQAHQDDIKEVDNALPSNPELGKLVYFFQKAAAENGMIIKDLFLSKSSVASTASKSNNIKDMVFSIDLLGGYSSLGNFIVSLEKSARLFEITNISFNSGSQTQSSFSSSQFQTQETYSFNLQIKTHSY